MAMPTMRDGTDVFYKDWGSGQPVALSLGWPLCADAWDSAGASARPSATH